MAALRPQRPPPLPCWTCIAEGKQGCTRYRSWVRYSRWRSSRCLASCAFSGTRNHCHPDSATSKSTWSSSRGQPPEPRIERLGFCPLGKPWQGYLHDKPLIIADSLGTKRGGNGCLTIKVDDDIADGTWLFHQLIQVLLHFTLIFISLYVN